MSDPALSKTPFRAALDASANAIRSLTKPDSIERQSELLDEKLALRIFWDNTERFDVELGSKALRSPPPPGSWPHAKIIPLPERSLALCAAAESPRAFYLKRLLEAGANPNALAAREGRDQNQRLLHRAAHAKRDANLWALMGAGAAPALVDSKGQTALMIAAEAAHPLSAQALIETGSPVDALDHAGRSALDRALDYRLVDDALRLESPGARELEQSAWRLAVGAQIALALLEAGASAAPSRSPAATASLPPLAAALRLQNLSLFRALLSRGAQPRWLLQLAPFDPDAPPPPDSGGVERFMFLLRRDPGARALIERAKLIAATRLPSPPAPGLDFDLAPGSIDAPPPPPPDIDDASEAQPDIDNEPAGNPLARHILARGQHSPAARR